MTRRRARDWRTLTYQLLALSNDVRAARNGTLHKRMLRRALGRWTGHLMGRIR